jgi:hypothetical protein
MTIRLLVGVLAFCVAMGGCYFANTAFYQMSREVDETRPDGSRYSDRTFQRHLMFDMSRNTSGYSPTRSFATECGSARRY